MPFSNAFSTLGFDQPFKDAVRRLALAITESAVLGCFEPNPISSCYDDELPRAQKAILRARDGKLARFRYQVNRNAFLGLGRLSGRTDGDQFGRPVAQADVTFNFTYAVIARHSAGCAAGMTLHMTKDIGLDPVWDFVTYGIP
jgi:hypothetical protein